jgi:DnaK suppressor protein
MLNAGQRDMQDVLQRRLRSESLAGPPGGTDDTEHAADDVQDDIDVALIQMKRETLRGVREALVRFDSGGGGHCLACGGAIGEKRLRALPFAVRCTACQTAHERHVTDERSSRPPEGFDWR